MNEFVYSYPTTVYFGQGAAAKHLPAALTHVGKTVMLAYGGGSIRKNGVYEEIKRILEEAGKTVVEFCGIMPNPTYAKVQEGAALAKEKGAEFILAVGGGSVIDCCKVISAQVKTEEDIWTLEHVEHRMPTAFLPMGAVVTASGTGAEMNNIAVITHEAIKTKRSMKGASPDFAVLDPSYTLSLPMVQVFSGVFDTLSHCMESYFGMPGCDNLTDQINEAIMRSVIRNARGLLTDPENLEIRGELEWASAMAENGMLKIGKVADFQAHQIEHQLGAYTDCNHGIGLAVIHPALYRYLYQAAVPRFARFANVVWGIAPAGKTEEELALAGIDALADFIKEIGLPATLTEMGIADDRILRAVADTCILKEGCCKRLERDEIFALLQECK